MNITRRLFLRHSAAVGAATVTAPTIAGGQDDPLPRERLDAAVAELKSAASAIWPSVNLWTINIDGTPSVPLLIIAYSDGKETRPKSNAGKVGSLS